LDRAELKRLRRIDEILRKTYGEFTPPGAEDPLDTLIRTVLSQNTSDVNSHRAFRELKNRFPDWEAAAKAPEARIEETIRSGGISRIKAHRIKQILAAVRLATDSYSLETLRNSNAAEAMEFLMNLPGVGVKTAAVVTLFGLGHPVFPVDTHVFRVSKRLGFVPLAARVEQVFVIMDAMVPDEMKWRLHLNLINHGRRICIARRPRCSLCPLYDLCPRAGVTQGQ
jgi:endonuclease-3